MKNAFGILAQRFHLYHRTLALTQEHTTKVVQATTMLHNYILRDEDIDVPALQEQDVQKYTGRMLEQMPNLKGNICSDEGARTRHKYRDYFLSDVGSIKWQSKYAHVNLSNRRYVQSKVSTAILQMRQAAGG